MWGDDYGLFLFPPQVELCRGDQSLDDLSCDDSLILLLAFLMFCFLYSFSPPFPLLPLWLGGSRIVTSSHDLGCLSGGDPMAYRAIGSPAALMLFLQPDSGSSLFGSYFLSSPVMIGGVWYSSPFPSPTGYELP